MRYFFKNMFARAVDSRKFDWLWERMSDTYLGYFARRLLHRIMGINEDAAIRDLVSRSRGYVLKMTHPKDHDDRYNVLIVQLPLPFNRKNKRILPLGIASLAAYVREKLPLVNVGILDAQCQNMECEEIVSKIREMRWDLIGISYWSVQSNLAYRISKSIKESSKDTVIVHGGVHSTVLPEEALNSADFVVLHEGEQTFAELILALMNKKSVEDVAGLAYKTGSEIRFTPKRPLIENLDDLPRPAYDLLPVDRYKMPLHVMGGDRLPVMGSRGCPYNCSFCTSPNLWQNRVRWRSAKNLVDEIQWLIDEYGVHNFHFWDDNFTLNPKFVRDFCAEIARRAIEINWVALDRAEHINRNKGLLKGMKKSGCVGIEIGLESANPDTFAHISKNQGLDDSKEAITNLKANDIIPLYTYMAFNPGESIVGYYMQKEFLDTAQEGYPWHRFFHPFQYPVYVGQFATPYPKTKFWQDLEKDSMILVDVPEDRFHHQINSIPYSLLKDVPVRTIDELNEDLFMIFLNAAKLNLWSYFPGHDRRDKLSLKLYDIWRFVIPFFLKCDGKRTLDQIGKELADELSMDYKKAMRLTAFATYIYAQVGAIRSALNHRDYSITLKRVKVPLAVKLDIVSLLKPAGITRGSLRQKL